MIRIVMLGRLGNNLFQYAFGRVMAEAHGVPLVLDASWFNHRTWPYVSHLGKLPGFTSGKAKLVRPFSTGSRCLLKLTGKHHWEYIRKPIVRETESDHSFDPTLLASPADCVAFGYFQSPLYFENLEGPLRQELDTSSLGLEAGHEEFAERLKMANSVAVHIRRTDYLSSSNLVSLSSDYYQRAMERMRCKVPNARFFVFSDDPAWCISQFQAVAGVEVFTGSNPYHPLLDLHLMSLAGHHIIANSSYSWWAAWLGKKAGQQVIMPNYWFHSGIHAPVEEKSCSEWEILDCQETVQQ